MTTLSTAACDHPTRCPSFVRHAFPRHRKRWLVSSVAASPTHRDYLSSWWWSSSTAVGYCWSPFPLELGHLDSRPHRSAQPSLMAPHSSGLVPASHFASFDS